MKILVPIKQVIDHTVNIRIQDNQVVRDNVKMAMNPFDEIALEEALRIKEAGHASEVIVLSLGDASVEDTLRKGLAMGADRAVLGQTERGETLEPRAVAKAIVHFAQQQQVGLILAGKQAIDDDSSQVPPMCAAMLGWPQASFASQVTLSGDRAQVVRETDLGLAEIKLPLPAVISADLRLNTPRFASLPNILKAKKKPLDKVMLSELALDLAPRQRVCAVRAPAVRQAGVILDNVNDLAEQIKKLI